MKKIIISLVLLLTTQLSTYAQNSCIFPMMVFVPEQAESIPSTAQNTLESKMRQLVTQNGMAGGVNFSNFCLIANTTENSKQVLSGMQPLVTLTLDLELFIGNNYTGEKFSSTSIRISGAGKNEALAYSAAFSSLNANNTQIISFLKNAKHKIYEYYETQVPNLITQAKNFAIKNEYEEAICLLSSVPTCCNKYPEVERCMVEIYQKYVNYDCAIKVNKARAIWNATQNKEGAKQAGAYLAAIDPSSSCNSDALLLAEQIRQRIGDDWEFYKEIKRSNIDVELARIEAIRAIGVAYGENQKALTVRENWLVR